METYLCAVTQFHARRRFQPVSNQHCRHTYYKNKTEMFRYADAVGASLVDVLRLRRCQSQVVTVLTGLCRKNFDGLSFAQPSLSTWDEWDVFRVHYLRLHKYSSLFFE